MSKDLLEKKILKNVRLSETRSQLTTSTRALVDTRNDLIIVSQEWCERMSVSVSPWEGLKLWMTNATTAAVIGVVDIEVSNA